MYYLYQHLDDWGYDQIVFCPSLSALSDKIAPKHLFLYQKRSGFDVFAAKTLKRVCRNRKVDLIHAHDAHAHTTAVLAAALFGNAVPIVLSRRVDFPIATSWFSKFKYNHSKIAAIACVSEAIQKIVSQGIHNPNIAITTIHSGVSPVKESAGRGVFRKAMKLPKDAFLVGNVAALADHKDYPTFLQTAKLLQNRSDVHFVVVGSGELEHELRELTTSLGLTNRVTFAGFHKGLAHVFADLDVLLFPSKTEGLGTTILDAFAYGVPVVATAAGGIPEMIDHRETGMLCKVGDAPCLAAAVEKVLGNSELRAKLIAGGRLKLQEFTAKSMAMKTSDLYQRLLDK